MLCSPKELISFLPLRAVRMHSVCHTFGSQYEAFLHVHMAQQFEVCIRSGVQPESVTCCPFQQARAPRIPLEYFQFHSIII